MDPTRTIPRRPLLLAAAAAVLALGLNPAVAAEESSEHYRVGQAVDKNTYTGWRVYHSACFACHGVDAVGTDVAPGLLEPMKTLTPETFTNKVIARYHLVMPRGAVGDDRTAVREALMDEVRRHERGMEGKLMMPAWGKDPDLAGYPEQTRKTIRGMHREVDAHILDLYGYLKARSDGALGPGEPGILRD